MKKKDFILELRNERSGKRRNAVIKLAVLIVFGWYLTCLPDPLFQDPTSTVVIDRNGELLGARIAGDGQWRFDAPDSVPYRFAQCLIQFEDRQFYSHAGISARGIGRAILQNARSGKRVSGGSTLTMQLARIMRKNPQRTYAEKVYEMILATRLEWSYSKEEILRLYAAHAPFGNNVVGLDAASWRYFGRPAHRLSWAESATLAVLPNAPGLIYPGKNHERLMAKRNRLLKRLKEAGLIGNNDYELALTEPLPGAPLPLPGMAPHLLDKLMLEGQKGKTVHVSVSRDLQEKAKRLLDLHANSLNENKIYNGAVMITSVKTGKVIAYVGNTSVKEEEHASYVDCADAPRSSGSILKPILYGAALDEGSITPEMLVTDVPSQFGSFSPKNFSGQFDGAIPVKSALSRSLNVPMVHLLKDYGVTKFHRLLRKSGFTTINRSARNYGLSLILGGAEVSLADLSKVYCGMARKLAGHSSEFSFSTDNKKKIPEVPISRSAIYLTFEAMCEVNRPDEDNNWTVFSSARKIAWKTGTSFGFRDAWAVGVTPDYVVAVWIGNADGEGRPGLTGVKAAAPLMFDLFRQLPSDGVWFREPVQDMQVRELCAESGFQAGKYCEHKKGVLLPRSSGGVAVCPYHRLIHLDATGTLRVDSDCADVFTMRHQAYFILPSHIEHYYRLSHPDYKVLPAYDPNCLGSGSEGAFSVLYPRSGSRIYVPIEITGEKGRTIFEVAHRHSGVRVFWHLDDRFIGETVEIHQLALNPSPGKHVLKVIDEFGMEQVVRFEVQGK